MNLLALDQSSRVTGWAVFHDKELVDSGTFTLTADNIGQRLVTYKNKIEELINKYEIEQVAFEDIQLQEDKDKGGIKNVQTFKVLAEVFGVTQEYLVEQNYFYHIVSSNTWKSKLQIKGKNRPEQKKNAQLYVFEHYGKKVSQDESDAICIGASVVLTKPDYNWD